MDSFIEGELQTDNQRQVDECVEESDAEFSPLDIDMTARRKASLEALKLYTGNLASLSTPMDRLIASQAEPHCKAGHTLDDALAWRDVETLDAKRLASELETEARESDEMSVGSLRPSSDTLSLSRERLMESMEPMKDRRERGTRNWRRLRMRRRCTMDRTKASKRMSKVSPPPAAS